MRWAPATLVSIGLILVACGGSTPAAESPAEEKEEKSDPVGSQDEASETGAEEAEEEVVGVPTKCVKDTPVCEPGKKFVKKLCNDSFPSLALNMFSGGTPWTRAYLAVRDVEPVNAFGGLSGGEHLTLDEEVIVLFQTMSDDPNAIQVSGSGSYQVLRWNGTCATLQEGELRMQRPGRPKAAKVTWRFLENGTREALRQNETITETYRARKKACRGATMGQVSAKCEKLDKKLHQIVVDTVREGSIELPTPEKLP
jgi:hypothetical protein